MRGFSSSVSLQSMNFRFESKFSWLKLMFKNIQPLLLLLMATVTADSYLECKLYAAMNYFCTTERNDTKMIKFPTSKSDKVHILLITNTEISLVRNGDLNFTVTHEINMKNNKIKRIENNAFKRQNLLRILNLSFNQIRYLPPGIFKDLVCLICLNMNNNHITKITPDIFIGLNCLSRMGLSNNNISHIPNETFKHLEKLVGLSISNNNIVNIENNAFYHNLKGLYLQNNKLTTIRANMFKNIRLIKIDLHNNEIQSIEGSVFDTSRLKRLDLSENKLSVLRWDTFDVGIDTNTYMNVYLENIDLGKNNIQCKRDNCWFQQGIAEGWITADVDDGCWDDCPNEDAQECQQNSTCMEDCQNLNKGFKLYMDHTVCPFQFSCHCVDCPDFNNTKCEQTCNKIGQIPMMEANEFNCAVCGCQCEDHNCTAECLGHPYTTVENIFNCLECKCGCPKLDCDAECNGEGLGIPGPRDEAGCPTKCIGCKKVNDSDDSNESGHKIILPAALIPAIVLFILLLFAHICVRNFIRKRTNKEQPEPSIVQESALAIFLKNMNPNLACEIKECWIDPAIFTVENFLGKGHFATVWLGKMQQAQCTNIDTAIKKIKAEYKDIWKVENIWTPKNELKPHFFQARKELAMNNQAVEDFLQEGLIMRKFNHPNLLSMFGISVHSNKPCVLLPLMRNGDLRRYIRSNESSLTQQDLFMFCRDVARGMDHLSEQGFVHCDLAARNCMLDENLSVKVSDFGLTKNVCEKDFYKYADSKKPLPIRWMSIEAIQDGVFTTQSDVWSYGVVLWEVFSFGEHPYEGIESTEIGKYLLEGYRMERPPLAPDFLFEIMEACWSYEPSQRPSFSTILLDLNKIIDTELGYVEVKNFTGK